MRKKRLYRPRFPRPKPPAASDPLDAEIARINDLSQTARKNWFSLLGYLAFVTVTLISVEHADFFVSTRQTALPLVGVSIPTERFFAAAPLVGVALCVYMHIYLTKLWEVLGKARREVGADALADRIQTWLVNDLVLNLPGEGRAQPKPLTRLSNWATRFLVWYAAPLILLVFWWRSMPAHEEGLTIWIGLCALVTYYASAVSWWKLRMILNGGAPTDSVWSLPRLVGAAAVIVLIGGLSWLRTEGSWGEASDPAWALTLDDEARDEAVAGGFGASSLFPSVDLAGVVFVPLPSSWRDHRTSRRSYRRDWCRAAGIADGPCYLLEPDLSKIPSEIWRLRQPVCDARGRAEDCRTYFAELDRQFRTDWLQERRASLRTLSSLDFGKEDFRRAKFPNTTMVAISLHQARLEGANFFRAKLEGASFHWAALHRVNFSQADMALVEISGAWISGTRFTDADLTEARFEDTFLVSTAAAPTLFDGARLSGASFGGSALKHVDLQNAMFDPLTDLSRSFGDATVTLPEGVTRPCQWSDQDLSITEFLGRWRWWVEKGGVERNHISDSKWAHIPTIDIPDDDPIRACEWK